MFNFRTVYGHVAGRVRSHGWAQCYITDASFESFSSVLVGCHRYYEQDNMWHACVGTARGSSIRSYPRTCSLLTGTDLVRFTRFAVEARRYLRVNDPGLHNAKCTSPQQTRMHSRGWVYILQRVNTLHSHLLCGSVLNRRTVLVRRLCVPGTNKTIRYLRDHTWWKDMISDVKAFCETCHTCKTSKPNNQKPYGLLNPLPVPTYPWESVGMDFVGLLPESGNRDGIFDSLTVVICLLTSMVHLIPSRINYNASQLAELMFEHVYKIHGFYNTLSKSRERGR